MTAIREKALPFSSAAPPYYSETVENYLRLVAVLQDETGLATATGLRRALKVSFPTVSNTLRRMNLEGLLYLEADHNIRLTPMGSVAAECVVRRHRLAERFLVDVLRVPWAEVFRDADMMEHTISPRIERQLLAVLENPTTCPHGNPMCLSTAAECGEQPLPAASGRVVIKRVRERAATDFDLMHWLERNRLMPGRFLEVQPAGAADFVIVVDADEHKLSVPLRAADVLVVTRSSEGAEPGQRGVLERAN
jgi:DtxR family Mn-dependent transcriptional regulator